MTTRCLSCGYLVDQSHACSKRNMGALRTVSGVERERACTRVRSPLTGREYLACFRTEMFAGVTHERVRLDAETFFDEEAA